MVFSYEDARDLIDKIISQANPTCPECGSKVRMEMNNGTKSFRCTWTPCRKKRSSGVTHCSNPQRFLQKPF